MHKNMKEHVERIMQIVVILVVVITLILFLIEQYHLERNLKVFDYVFGIGTIFLIITAIILVYSGWENSKENNSQHQGLRKHLSEKSTQNIEEQKLFFEVSTIIIFGVFLFYLPILERYVDATTLFVILIISFLFVRLLFYYFFDTGSTKKNK